MKQNQVTHNLGTHLYLLSSLQLSINLAYPTNLIGQTNQRGKSKEKSCPNPAVYCLRLYLSVHKAWILNSTFDKLVWVAALISISVWSDGSSSHMELQSFYQIHPEFINNCHFGKYLRDHLCPFINVFVLSLTY